MVLIAAQRILASETAGSHSSSGANWRCAVSQAGCARLPQRRISARCLRTRRELTPTWPRRCGSCSPTAPSPAACSTTRAALPAHDLQQRGLAPSRSCMFAAHTTTAINDRGVGVSAMMNR
jgi:hypothetical protein